MSLKRLSQYSYSVARRIVIAMVGVTVCLIGIMMLVTPGPAVVVIPAGLAILGVEFAFARRWLHSLKEKINETLRSEDESVEDHTAKQYNPWKMWQPDASETAELPTESTERNGPHGA